MKIAVSLNQRIEVVCLCVCVLERNGERDGGMVGGWYEYFNDYHCFCRILFVHLSVGECKFIVDGCVKQPATRVLSVAVAVVVILAAVFIVGIVVIVTELLMILLL